jgi:hypothetical protein
MPAQISGFRSAPACPGEFDANAVGYGHDGASILEFSASALQRRNFNQSNGWDRKAFGSAGEVTCSNTVHVGEAHLTYCTTHTNESKAHCKHHSTPTRASVGC